MKNANEFYFFFTALTQKECNFSIIAIDEKYHAIRLLLSGLKTDASVCLYDLPRHLIYTSKIENSNIYEINTSAIKAGLYVLNLKDEKQSISKKIVLR